MRNRCLYSLVVLVALAMSDGANVMAAEFETLATTAGKPVALGPGPMSVTLAAPPGSALSKRVAAVAQGRKVYLQVKGLATNEAPEVLYQVYLGLPRGAAPKPEGIHYVGSFNFFNVTQGGGLSRSFDVTDLVKALQARKELGDTASVTIVPTDKPRATAKPVVAEIALVEQ